MTPPPGTLNIRTGMSGLEYRVSTWEKATLWFVAPYVASLLVFVVCLVLRDSVSAALAETLNTVVAVNMIALMGLPILQLVVMVGLRPWFRADVTVDVTGMSITERGEHRRVLWAECGAVRRKGRKIEVMRDGEWQRLPAPNGTADARWLEDLIAQHIAARADDATAVPADVAAAFAAMREPEP